jgi:transcriptional regulator with XRE-family HTH domain
MLSDTVGEQITAWRKRLGMSREQLADLCSRFHMPELTHAALTNIESGRRNKDGIRRRAVSVDEISVIALALGVAPILLMFPYPEREFGTIPGEGREGETYKTLFWFTGEMELHSDADPGLTVLHKEQWRESVHPLEQLREHQSLVATLIRQLHNQGQLDLVDQSLTPESWREIGGERHMTFEMRKGVQKLRREGMAKEITETDRAILTVRDRMREKGWPLPDLPKLLVRLRDITLPEYEAITALPVTNPRMEEIYSKVEQLSAELVERSREP